MFADHKGDSGPGKKKRTMFTLDQKGLLELQFTANPYPDKSQRKRLAEDLDVTDKSIDYWFGHRRAKQAKQKRSGPSAVSSPASGPRSGLFDVDSPSSPSTASTSDDASVLETKVRPALSPISVARTIGTLVPPLSTPEESHPFPHRH